MTASPPELLALARALARIAAEEHAAGVPGQELNRDDPFRTTCAIYARYSSDKQSERSAEDQARLCQERATREGWDVTGSYADLALSGATRDRPGLNALLDAAERFDVVLAESIDRLSRDQEDIAAIWKRLRYAGVRLVTLSEGDVGEIHVGLGGTMAALYLRQLGEKTRRGQLGRVEAGRIPGGLSYGYAPVPGFDAQGRPDRGARTIVEPEAEVVRRVFAEFLAGRSPKAIAEGLNRDGIPGPTGGTWGASTIAGNARRGTGILHNALYAGRIVYNRQRFEKHPVTRKRVAKLNPESEWRTADVPALAIVDAMTWAAVAKRFLHLDGVPAHVQRRPKRLFSGLVRCGVCSGGFSVIAAETWGCSGRRAGRGCDNTRTITTAELERRVLGALSSRMLAPDVIADYIREGQRLAEDGRRQRLSGRATLERRHARAQGQLDRLVDAIADGRGEFRELSARMRAIAAERDQLAIELADLAAEPIVAALPNFAEAWRRQFANLALALKGMGPEAHAARDQVRALLDTIVASPRIGARGVDLDLQGRLAEILALTTQEGPLPKGTALRTLSMVAGTQFDRCRTRFRL